MPVLWIHRMNSSDFLVRGETERLRQLAQEIVSEMKCTTCKDDGDLPQTADLQFSLEKDDFVPERHFYHEVSYVTPADAYKMTLWDIFPEDHFRHEDSTYKLPKGFIVRNRDEPYDFTRPIPSVKELDEELSDYFAQLPATADEGLDPTNCPLHIQKMTGRFAYEVDDEGNYPSEAPSCCCSLGINEAIARLSAH
jgi:hypothetical protein